MPNLAEWRAAREETQAAPPFELKMDDGEVITFPRGMPLAVVAYLVEGELIEAIDTWLGEEARKRLLDAGVTLQEFIALVAEVSGVSVGELVASGSTSAKAGIS